MSLQRIVSWGAPHKTLGFRIVTRTQFSVTGWRHGPALGHCVPALDTALCSVNNRTVSLWMLLQGALRRLSYPGTIFLAGRPQINHRHMRCSGSAPAHPSLVCSTAASLGALCWGWCTFIFNKIQTAFPSVLVKCRSSGVSQSHC